MAFHSEWNRVLFLVLAQILSHGIFVDAEFTLTAQDIEFANAEAMLKENTQASIDKLISDGRQTSLIQKRDASANGDTSQFILDFMVAICQRKNCSDEDKLELQAMKPPFQVRALSMAFSCDSPTNVYRTIDGTCNNIARPLEGSSPMPHHRFIQPAYDDGIQAPRSKSVTGGLLPEPRMISDNFIQDTFTENTGLTTILTYFGQTIDHDFTSTPSVTANGNSIKCCPGTDGSTPNHPACMAIKIAEGDSFFRQFNQDCMEFVRSRPMAGSGGTFGVRQQMNQITSFIDASFIYGSDLQTANNLRTRRNGLMKTGVRNLLPPNIGDSCTATSNSCPFLAGDSRSNENPGLTLFHTIFLREHNRLAKEVKALRPSWNDEKLYQETRKIVIAFVQNIVYNEFVPNVIGSAAMRKYGLRLPNRPDPNVYDTEVKPMIRNAFSTAAYRFGHSLVTPTIKLDFTNAPDRDFKLEDKLLRTSDLYSTRIFNAMTRGMTTHAVQKFDRFMTSSLSKHLFRSLEARFGLDLASINIQRGRDHGLPSYNTFREYCGLRRLRSFRNQLRPAATIYKSIDDVDLFVGGLSERPVRGGIVGPTFACLIGQQFEALMKGDRFFFTNGVVSGTRSKRQSEPSEFSHWWSKRGTRAVRRFSRRRTATRRRRRRTTVGTTTAPPQADPLRVGHQYTSAQIREFRKANLARIICDNTGLTEIQRIPMKVANRRNPVVRCSQLVSPNLRRILPQ